MPPQKYSDMGSNYNSNPAMAQAATGHGQAGAPVKPGGPGCAPGGWIQQGGSCGCIDDHCLHGRGMAGGGT